MLSGRGARYEDCAVVTEYGRKGPIRFGYLALALASSGGQNILDLTYSNRESIDTGGRLCSAAERR